MPGTSIRPYDAFYAASQRAKGPFTSAASSVPLSHDRQVAALHGAIPVLGGAAFGGTLGALVPKPKNKDREDLVLGGAAKGALISAPIGLADAYDAMQERGDARRTSDFVDSFRPDNEAGNFITELRREFPGVKDRGIAAKLHPDIRGTTEAPPAVMDDAYNILTSKARNTGAQRATATGSVAGDGIADFLRSWRKAR
jgi:hypothetical protein